MNVRGFKTTLQMLDAEAGADKRRARARCPPPRCSKGGSNNHHLLKFQRLYALKEANACLRLPCFRVFSTQLLENEI